MYDDNKHNINITIDKIYVNEIELNDINANLISENNFEFIKNTARKTYSNNEKMSENELEKLINDTITISLKFINTLDKSNLILYSNLSSGMLPYMDSENNSVAFQPYVCASKNELPIDIKNKIIVIYYSTLIGDNLRFICKTFDYDLNNTYIYKDENNKLNVELVVK